MAIGTVKFFNADRGYGFITNEAGGKDAFVHISAVERSGMTSLKRRPEAQLRARDRPRRQGLRGQPAGRINLPGKTRRDSFRRAPHYDESGGTVPPARTMNIQTIGSQRPKLHLPRALLSTGEPPPPSFRHRAATHRRRRDRLKTRPSRYREGGRFHDWSQENVERNPETLSDRQGRGRRASASPSAKRATTARTIPWSPRPPSTRRSRPPLPRGRTRRSISAPRPGSSRRSSLGTPRKSLGFNPDWVATMPIRWIVRRDDRSTAGSPNFHGCAVLASPWFSSSDPWRPIVSTGAASWYELRFATPTRIYGPGARPTCD